MIFRRKGDVTVLFRKFTCIKRHLKHSLTINLIKLESSCIQASSFLDFIDPLIQMWSSSFSSSESTFNFKQSFKLLSHHAPIVSHDSLSEAFHNAFQTGFTDPKWGIKCPLFLILRLLVSDCGNMEPCD